jgi:hypothetical protein
VTSGTKVLDSVEISAADADRLPVTAPVSNQDDAGATYKTLRFRFPNAITPGAGQYEVRISSPGSTATSPWFVAALMAEAHTTDQTFGGTTDYAAGQFLTGTPPVLTPLTSGGVRSSDALLELVEVPGPVTGVGTSVGSLTAHHVEVCDPNVGCEGCSDDTMPYVQVTWSPAPSGNPDVAAYHVDRMDDLSPDWERVAYVAGRTNTAWNDHEVRIGVASSYRVRVVRTDAVTGDWSAATSASKILVPPGQVALAFSSNAATGMGCVYPEVWTGEVVRSWDFLEAGDVKLRQMFGRDGQVAFRPLERKGDHWQRQVLLSALCSVARPSMALFNPLRDLAWAPVPYVCVRDGEGNRWLASLTVTGGDNRRADTANTELWLADIGITVVATVPAVHDTTVAQVEGPAHI